jgi:putative ABC transport system substrate-binding protein
MAPLNDMNETGSVRYRAFFQRLRQLGYVEGQNLLVGRYSGEGQTEHFGELAHQVVRANPDVIFVTTFRVAHDFKAATDTIPIVASGGDPVAFGIATSLARPGGNITGVTVDAGMEISGKYLELLRELVPSVSRVAFLASRGMWESGYGAVNRDAAERMKISLVGTPLEPPFDEAAYRRAFAAMAEEGVNGLYVSGQPENYAKRQLIVELAELARLPAIYVFREFADVGGLMAYAVDITDMYRHAADQIDQILKGAKPSEIPFYQPTKFQLVINLKAAKALGITVPPTLLIAAEEVIE